MDDLHERRLGVFAIPAELSHGVGPRLSLVHQSPMIERQRDQMRQRACPQEDIWHDALAKPELDNQRAQPSLADQQRQRQADDSAGGGVGDKGVIALTDRMQPRRTRAGDGLVARLEIGDIGA